jgi:hypothetical protein
MQILERDRTVADDGSGGVGPFLHHQGRTDARVPGRGRLSRLLTRVNTSISTLKRTRLWPRQKLSKRNGVPLVEDINETAWGTKNSSSKMIRATLRIFARADMFSYSAENAAIWTVRPRRDS